MVKAQRHEREDGPPQADDFGREVAALHAEEARQTDQPVAADTAEENLDEGRDGLLLVYKVLDGGQERVGVEDTPVCSG